MIWIFLVFYLGVASASDVEHVEPEYLDWLKITGQDKEFARLMRIDVSLVRSSDDERSEVSRFNKVSPLGDILLLPGQEELARTSLIDFQKYPLSMWPNGIVPYYISREYTSLERAQIRADLEDLNSRVTNVRIVPWSGQKDYVLIMNGDGCYAYLGRIGGQQILSLSRNGCLNTGTVQHEMMHTLGFTHEQCRADRDDFVKILWHNIPESWWSQYYKADPNIYILIGSYEYYSIMHYPIWAPETGKDAFEILQDNVDRNKLGHNGPATKMDAVKIDTAYAR